jgi:malate synthase
MEDAATGEIRVSVLWEWLHKGAPLTQGDDDLYLRKGDKFSLPLFQKLLAQEYNKLQKANGRDVYTESKKTTLPIAKEIVQTFILNPIKAPWYIDLLNLNINNQDLKTAKNRIDLYYQTLKTQNQRVTRNLDFLNADEDENTTATNRSVLQEQAL